MADAADTPPTDEEIVAACNWWLKKRSWRETLQNTVDELLPADLFAQRDSITRRIFEVWTEPDIDEETGQYWSREYNNVDEVKEDFGRVAMKLAGYAEPDIDISKRAGETLERLVDAYVQRRVQSVFSPDDNLLSVILAPAIKSRCDALKAGGDDKNRYAERIQTSCAAFVDIVGDRPLSMYTPANLQEFATVLGSVPANMRKRKVFDGLGYRAAVAKNATLETPYSTLAVGTIEAYPQEFRNIWRLATAGMVGIRDITNISITMPKNAPRKAIRTGLPAESLNIWFSHAAGAKAPHLKWLPLLGLLTGMRLAEMVYLQPRDLVQVRDSWALDIRTDLEFDEDEDQERPIKNDNSRRLVALHGFLVQCGFVEWMQAQTGEEYIFPRYHRVSDPADQAQKDMGKVMRDLEIHRPHVQVFHSLRHNAKDWLRDHVKDRTADIQCGHVPESVGGRYGSLTLRPLEIEQLAAIDLPADVDFSPYLNPTAAPRTIRKGRPEPAERPVIKRKKAGRPPKGAVWRAK
jgi:integrase